MKLPDRTHLHDQVAARRYGSAYTELPHHDPRASAMRHNVASIVDHTIDILRNHYGFVPGCKYRPQLAHPETRNIIRDTVARSYTRGGTLRTIGDRHNITHSTIRDLLEEAGIERRGNHPKPEIDAA